MSSKAIGLSQNFLYMEIIMCWLLILQNTKSYTSLRMDLGLCISKCARFAPVLLRNSPSMCSVRGQTHTDGDFHCGKTIKMMTGRSK